MALYPPRHFVAPLPRGEFKSRFEVDLIVKSWILWFVVATDYHPFKSIVRETPFKSAFLQNPINCFLFLLFFLSGYLQAQEKPFKPHYVNMTEIGGLFGRVVYDIQWNTPTTQEVTNRLNLTLQTFNGAQIKPRLAVGLTTGVDWYNSVLLLPIAVGARYDLVRSKKNVALFGSLDAGYGFNWLNVNGTGYDTQGGMMLNPGVGLKFGFKSGSALTLSLTYKRQNAKVNKPLGWQEVEKWEDRTYNRMALRLGIWF